MKKHCFIFLGLCMGKKPYNGTAMHDGHINREACIDFISILPRFS